MSAEAKAGAGRIARAWRAWRPDDRRACLLAYGLLALWCFPLYAALDTRGSIGSDWEYFLTYWEAARGALLDGELPGYNPFNALGSPVWANPQIGPISHYTPLVLLFGTLAGVKIGLTLSYFLAFETARVLGREVLSRPLSAVIFGLLYALNSALAAHLTRGQLSFAAYPWLPLLVLAVLRMDRRWAGAWAGIVVGVIVHYGVHYVALYGIFLAGALALAVALRRRAWGDLARFGGLFVLSSVATAGARLGPMLALMADHPRDIAMSLVFPPEAFWRAFFVPSIGSGQAWLRASAGGFDIGAWELEAYVGYLVLGLVAYSLKGGVRFYHVGALFAGWAMLGSTQPWHLSRWLAALPPFDSAWLVFRWRVVLLCCLALAAARGIDLLCRWAAVRERGARVAAVIAWLVPLELVVLLLPSWSAHVSPYEAMHLTRKELGLVATDHMISVARYTLPNTKKRVLFALAKAKVGTKYGYEPLFGYGRLRSVRRYVGHPGYRGEYVVAGQSVIPRRWARNALDFAGLTPGASLEVNLNPGRGWTERGRALFGGWRAFEPGKRFRVRVPADGALRLRYRPPGLGGGLVASALAALLFGGVALWWRRRGR